MPGLYQQSDIELSLFDMVHEPYEKINVIDEYPEIADILIRIAEEHKVKYFE